MSAAVRIAGIGSVFGNVPVKDAAANLARFVAFFGRSDIPLGFGADQPLEGNLDWFTEWRAGYGKTPPFEGRLPDIAVLRPADRLRPQAPGQDQHPCAGPDYEPRAGC